MSQKLPMHYSHNFILCIMSDLKLQGMLLFREKIINKQMQYPVLYYL